MLLLAMNRSIEFLKAGNQIYSNMVETLLLGSKIKIDGSLIPIVKERYLPGESFVMGNHENFIESICQGRVWG